MLKLFQTCIKKRVTVNVISPNTTCSWINFPINQSDKRDKFIVYVKFRLRTRVKYFCICVIGCILHGSSRQAITNDRKATLDPSLNLKLLFSLSAIGFHYSVASLQIRLIPVQI